MQKYTTNYDFSKVSVSFVNIKIPNKNQSKFKYIHIIHL